MAQNNQDRMGEQKGLGEESTMVTPTPEVTRQPLDEQTKDQMQKQVENSHSENPEDMQLEDIDEIVQEGGPTQKPSVGEQQLRDVDRLSG